MMTEYEVIAATEAMAQTSIGLSDISASNIAIYLSMIFAYTTVAYVAGKNLSRTQVTIATFVYVISSLYIVLNIIGFAFAPINVLERMAVVNPDKLSLLEAQRFSLWLDIIIWPSLMLVSLIFMWNIRREKES